MYAKLAAIAALALVPALAAAQERDTTRRDTTQRDTGNVVSDTARGRLETGRMPRNLGLDQSEVMRLQQALNDMGCNSGNVDGIVGPVTRRAIQCARRQHNITGNDLNELFRALNLDISTDDAGGATPTDTSAVPRDTTGLPPRDTTGGIPRDTTFRGDSVVRDTMFRRDTSFRRDTTFGRDSLLRRDTTFRRDTLMRRDSARTEGDTSRSRRDTTRRSP